MSIINSIKCWFDRIYFAIISKFKVSRHREQKVALTKYEVSETHIEHLFLEDGDRETTYYLSNLEL
jgi:hypothetical protein